MNDSIIELQKRQFGFLHDYHRERTGDMLDLLVDKYGKEVIDIVEKAGTDRYGLYKWHLERTIKMLDSLGDKFGPEVMTVVVENERNKRYEEGRKLAEDFGDNSLEKIIPWFTNGDNDRIIERNENEVFIKTTGCLSGKISYELRRNGMLYDLHCGLDKYFVEGFNNELGCEITKTIMEGSEYCIHRIYKK